MAKRKRPKPKPPTDAQMEKEVADFMEWATDQGYQLKPEGGGLVITNTAGKVMERDPVVAAYSIAVAKGWKPVNKEFLRLAADDVAKRFPDGWGFILLATPVGAGGRVAYVSNFDRSDAIKTLKEFLFAQGEAADWMKHIK